MSSYARMLDKKKKPTEDQVAKTIGPQAQAHLIQLEAFIREHYNLSRELRFPFGNNYGWGYKYSHARRHLCYVFFEEGAFTVTLQIGDQSVAALEKALPEMLPQTQALWAERYPCGDHGGWIHCRVLSDAMLPDICKLLTFKVKPIRP